jgi:hypothetical protein
VTPLPPPKSRGGTRQDAERRPATVLVKTPQKGPLKVACAPSPTANHLTRRLTSHATRGPPRPPVFHTHHNSFQVGKFPSAADASSSSNPCIPPNDLRQRGRSCDAHLEHHYTEIRFVLQCTHTASRVSHHDRQSLPAGQRKITTILLHKDLKTGAAIQPQNRRPSSSQTPRPSVTEVVVLRALPAHAASEYFSDC